VDEDGEDHAKQDASEAPPSLRETEFKTSELLAWGLDPGDQGGDQGGDDRNRCLY